MFNTFQNTNSQPAQQPITTPTPRPKSTTIRILNGSIVDENIDGTTKTLIRKEDYPHTGIAGFSQVFVSPDELKICFESRPPSLEPYLYIANIDGSNVIPIKEDRKDCTWSPDSSKIAYTSYGRGTGAVDIFVYDIANALEENLTASTESVREYKITGFVEDNLITCSYIDSTDTSTPSSSISRNCQIELDTGAIVEK